MYCLKRGPIFKCSFLFLLLQAGVFPFFSQAFAQGARSETTRGEVVGNALSDESISLQPQLGMISYEDLAGNGHGRMAVGAMVEANLLKWVDIQNLDNKKWFIGPSSGIIYSHIGASDANFFGTNSDSNNQGSNFFSIPINVKAGYLVTDNLRTSLHLGGNFTYRSMASSMNLGNTSTGTGSQANLFANLGADLEYTVSKSLALNLRPDITFASGRNIFSGTVAVIIPLGTV